MAATVKGAAIGISIRANMRINPVHTAAPSPLNFRHYARISLTLVNGYLNECHAAYASPQGKVKAQEGARDPRPASWLVMATLELEETVWVVAMGRNGHGRWSPTTKSGRRFRLPRARAGVRRPSSAEPRPSGTSFAPDGPGQGSTTPISQGSERNADHMRAVLRSGRSPGIAVVIPIVTNKCADYHPRRIYRIRVRRNSARKR